MVKAMGEASIKIHHDGQETNIFFHKFSEVKPGIAIELTKKLKGPSPLRRLFFSSSTKTKRKDKDSPDEGKQYLQDDYARQRVIDVNFEHVVELPCGIDLQEWLATNMIKFFEHINQLYGAVAEYCTTTNCTCMAAPNNVQYQWVEDKGKKVKCAAPQYVDYVMLYTQKTICDETVFPTKYGNVFPASFDATMKKLFRLLFHVVAHIYHSHFKHILYLNLQGHLNTTSLHFLLFCKSFSLVEEREMEVLDDLYRKLSSVNVKVIGKDDSKTSLSSAEMESGGDNKYNSSRGNSPVKSPQTECNDLLLLGGGKSHMEVDSIPTPHSRTTLLLTQADFSDDGDENKENVISPPLPLPPPPSQTGSNGSVKTGSNGSIPVKTGSNGSLPPPPQQANGHARKTSST